VTLSRYYFEQSIIAIRQMTTRFLIAPIHIKDIAMDAVRVVNAVPLDAAPIIAQKTKLSALEKNTFLAALSETANVSASARKAGLSTSKVYRERRTKTKFRELWMEALREGYIRLESDLLAEALRTPSAQISDMMLKARTQKQRLGTTLLTMHRQSVKAESIAKPVLAKQEVTSFTSQLLAKLMAMRSNNDNKRIGQDRAIGGEGG
jgi:hypothetical protein